MKYMNLTIDQLHDLLVNKEVTPLDLAKEAIELAKKDTNNAFEYIMEKEALEIASKLTEPEIDNPLWGIPFAIKDNISTKDVPTTASSNILNGYVPLFNATVVEKLLNKHAVPIGKTTLDELAMGGTGTSGHLGMTYNPYDETHTRLAGGSSCGSAAATSAPIRLSARLRQACIWPQWAPTAWLKQQISAWQRHTTSPRSSARYPA